jgi:hypothetical protein
LGHPAFCFTESFYKLRTLLPQIDASSECRTLLAPDSNTLFAGGEAERFFFAPTPRFARRVKGQNTERFRFLDDDSFFHTSLLTADPSLFEPSKGVAVMLPGMGGNVHNYGVVASTGQFIKTMLSDKTNFYPIALQNWVYFGTGRLGISDPQRSRISELFSDLSTQMETLEWALENIFGGASQFEKKLGIPKKTKGIITRSNGTGLTLQLLSDAVHGNPRAFEIVKNLSFVMLAGLNSPEPAERALWMAAEDRLTVSEPGELDPIALSTDRSLYSQMTFARPGNVSHLKIEGLPPLIFLIAAMDEYVSVKNQIKLAEQFAANHPQFPVILVYTPLAHDPLRRIKFAYQKPDMRQARAVQFKTGQIFRKVLNTHFLERKAAFQSGVIERVFLDEFFLAKEEYRVAIPESTDEET